MRNLHLVMISARGAVHSSVHTDMDELWNTIRNAPFYVFSFTVVCEAVPDAPNQQEVDNAS